MENKTINNAKTPCALQLERSPSFEMKLIYVNHKFDSDNKWLQCKTNTDSHILFNVAFPLNMIDTLDLVGGDEVRVTFKAINRDSTRPSSYKFTAVDITRNVEIVEIEEDGEVIELVHDDHNYPYGVKDKWTRTHLNSHRGTFVKAVQDKVGSKCDLYFDMKVKREDGSEVITPMAFRSDCRRYYEYGFNGAEGKDFRLWINAGKTCLFFTEDGEENVVYEKKGDSEFLKYFHSLFLASAEKIRK